MSREARLVVPGYPHHVTQRGNRKQSTFFCDDDYRSYLRLLRENLTNAKVEIWAYCLMPNHVHLVAVPETDTSLARLFRSTHHRYARMVNARNGWQGHLWQERFYSSVMDERHLLAAVRYVELNPVRAGLCQKPTQWRWSSVHAHLNDSPDPVVNSRPMHDRVSNWAEYLSESDDHDLLSNLRRQTQTGWPAGDKEFISGLESRCARRLRRLKPGPKPKK